MNEIDRDEGEKGMEWDSNMKVMHKSQDGSKRVGTRMTFFAIIRSIWLFRNDLVFKSKVLDIRQFSDIIKLKMIR